MSSYTEVYSYNAGYHRGLNTEYHDIPIEDLFQKWREEHKTVLNTVNTDLISFEEGYKQGLIDYQERYQ